MVSPKAAGAEEISKLLGESTQGLRPLCKVQECEFDGN